MRFSFPSEDRPVSATMAGPQVISWLAEFSDLDRDSVARVFQELSQLVKRELKRRDASEFVIPGLMKLRAAKSGPAKGRADAPFPPSKPFVKSAYAKRHPNRTERQRVVVSKRGKSK